MPTYDYECSKCEHRFEQFQGLNDKRLRKCPACGKQGLVRLFGSGIGVVFKGSGFYETDYKRAGGSSGKESTSTSADKGGSGSAQGGDKGKGQGGAKKD